jgi:ABC-2 type transport system permease protein
LSLLNDIQNNPSATNDLQTNQNGYQQEISDLEKTEKDLADLEAQLAEFQSISPAILVRPFTVKTVSASQRTYTPMDFFTPAVIVLLLQHVSVTIASLSIVRERRSGTMELFRVSPVTSLETLLGKYLSYILFVAIIGAILGVLLAFVLKAPMLGSWVDLALVAVALIFSSLGLGFLISLVADTESQAVQFAMIALLLSVFFSGFMLDLRYLWQPIRVISWILPATHAITLLQNIMLRGNPIIQIYMGALLLIGFVLFVLALLLLRRRMARE